MSHSDRLIHTAKQEPDGIYESTFVTAIMSIYLNSTKGSRLDAKAGHPKGALATTATAVSYELTSINVYLSCANYYFY